ncbi:neuraminidase-like domain-containing protein [Haliscomenobacter hydrossis]|uniref:PA14 domain protein n=1 Tax=Haliscomenobacter hydrossis (strain ATCC 27775 / DSM 1100 / LMG 10767 / O) TaxID=760192 RepID=F4KSF8_HALH1|nr:neuraminidase-like domain-containing protein [Haliscomenobacter hydrossis]AEE53361.1 PA14 domain protein [Haliscomenobacter hydrossis DSM 1100]
MATFTIQGKITDTIGKPQRGLVIRASDKDFTGENSLGKPVLSDEDGTYRLVFTTADFVIQGKETTAADIVVRAFDREGKLLAKSPMLRGSEQTPDERAGKAPVVVNLVVGRDQDVEDFSVVRGRVTLGSKPVKNQLVRAYDQDLPSKKENRQELGMAYIDAYGRYYIVYTPKKARRAETGTADVVLDVPSTKETETYRSTVYYNAGQELIVDIELQGTPAAAEVEFERYIRIIQPIADEVPFDLLQAADLEFIANETGIPPIHVSYIQLAFAWNVQSKMEADVFYGLLRKGFSQQLPNWTVRRAGEFHVALREAIQESIIVHRSEKDAGEQVRQLLQFLASIVAEGSDTDNPTAVSLAVRSAIADATLSARFLEQYLERPADEDAFWGNMASDEVLGAYVPRIQLGLNLSGITSGNLALTKELLDRPAIGSLQDLTSYSKTDWKSLIEDSQVEIPAFIAGETPEEKAFNYADQIYNRLEDTLPMAYVQSAATNMLEPEVWSGVSQFLDRYPNYNFREKPIGKFIAELRNNSDDPFSGIEAAPRVEESLLRIGRLYNVAGKAERTKVLWEYGYTGASQIAGSPLKTLTRKLTNVLPEKEIVEIYNNAAQVNGMSLLTYSAIMEYLHYSTPSVVENREQPTNHETSRGMGESQVPAGIRNIPNWQELFGSLDSCSCDHCRSVYSPTAYFVDFLHHLLGGEYYVPDVWNEASSPYRELIARRPDLQHLKLTCENTNTRIPYIDLVNEILETYIVFNETLERDSKAPDTGKATADELAAEPQYIEQTAYSATYLGGAVYPLSLPFNLHLETSRAYAAHLGTSLFEIKKTIAGGNTPALNAEYLGLSETDYQILTGKTFAGADTTLDVRPHRLYGYDGPGLDAHLGRLKTFMERCRLTWDEVDALRQTNYLNKGYHLYALLEDPESTEEQKGAIRDLAANHQVFYWTITITGSDPCQLENLFFRYKNGESLSDAHFARIARFIRLWKKLGCTVMELDLLLTAFTQSPGEFIPEAIIENISSALQLRDRLKMPIDQLVCLWYDIPTIGRKSLFRRVFAGVSATQPFFRLDFTQIDLEKAQVNMGYSSGSAAILGNVWGFSSEDVRKNWEKIYPGANAPITISTQSAYYRHALFTQSAKISLADFFKLSEWTNIQAFERPANTLAMLDMVEMVKRSGFTINELQFLVEHTAEYWTDQAPKQEKVLLLAKTIREGLQKVSRDTKLPDSIDRGVVLTKLELWLEPTVATAIVRYLDEDFSFEVPLELEESLNIPNLNATRLQYRDKEKKLISTGFMTNVERDHLMSLLPSDAFRTAIQTLFGLSETQKSNFNQWLGEDNILQFIPGTPDLPAFNRLFNSPEIMDAETGRRDKQRVFRYFLQQLLPFLRLQLREKLLIDLLAGEFSLTPELVALIYRKGIRHSFDKEAISAVEMGGIECFSVPAGASETVGYGPVDTVWAVGTNTAVQRADWNGYMIAPASEEFTLYIDAKDQVQFWLDDNLLINNRREQDRTVHQFKATLKAGKLYSFRLLQLNIRPGADAVTRLSWSHKNMERQVIHPDHLLDANLFNSFYQQYVSFTKASLLTNKFQLTAEEVEWMLGRGASDFDHLDLYQPNFNHWLRLAQYAALQKESGISTSAGLIPIFQTADANKSNQDIDGKIVQVLGWTTAEISAIRSHYRPTTGELRNEILLSRLQKQISFSRKLKIELKQLFTWTSETDFSRLSNHMKQALSARYDGSEWLEIAKKINDPLRARRRDVLMDYLLARFQAIPQEEEGLEARITTPADLYAYFLIDVEMDPCMSTSRIVQANASLQLFAQRCLMNLEKNVSPETIDLDRYEWMRKYRVWEANRKVFLYPENWIEPELRDDKSEFFKALESELLQGEVTEENAQKALLDYLYKLDSIAYPDVRAFCEDPDSGELHVIARTHHTPQQYFYRKRTADQRWLAWEKVNVDVEGDSQAMVVWKGRLYLFWLNFFEKNTSDNLSEQYWEVKLVWSEYDGKSWLPKQISNHYIISPTTFAFDSRYPNAKYRKELKSHFITLKKSSTLNIEINFSYPEFEVTPNVYGQSDWWNCAYYRVGKFIFYSFGQAPTTEDHDIIAQVRNIGPFFIKGHFYTLRRQFQLFQTNNTGLILLSESNIPHINIILKQFINDRNNSKSFFIKKVRIFDQINLHYDVLLDSFYYSFSQDFIKSIHDEGVSALFNKDNQLLKEGVGSNQSTEIGYRDTIFFHFYQPDNRGPVRIPENYFPKESVDFSQELPYSVYNWEIFFHIPMLIANRLHQNQRFQEAQQWYHYIFNPTASDNENSPKRFWNVLPFRSSPTENIENLLRKLQLPADHPEKQEVISQIQAWRSNPFNPHLIARFRHSAYMKNVVMKYIDNLLAWGDSLFSQDTMESINEATQIYLLAAEVLGPRPVKIPRRTTSKPETYDALRERLDEFGNAFEDSLDFGPTSATTTALNEENSLNVNKRLSFYFCIPDNSFLLKYWDTVADRLFKIRHCQNIEGIVRQLDLFEPEIDPALLVRAKALGLDIGSVLRDLHAPLPHYRFTYILQKAFEICAEVKALGNSLLSALEKKDAEELSRIRAKQETQMLNLIMEIKLLQLQDARTMRENLDKNRESASYRWRYYKTMLGEQDVEIPELGTTIQETQLPSASDYGNLSGFESEDLEKAREAKDFGLIANTINLSASVAHFFPNIHVGWGAGTTFGGSNIGSAISAIAKGVEMEASLKSYDALRASKLGGFYRRQQEWTLQCNLAAKEIMSIDKQIASADIRISIAEKELNNHYQQIENAREIESFLRSKWTNEELYGWMQGAISGIFFQSYQLAFDLAKRAEKTFRYELGVTDSNYIQFGYWDGRYKGLLAGERLHLALKQLEKAYLDQNRRELELTKHVSLKLLNPLALLQLREAGKCDFAIPEELFDLDFPGHYFRRIKSVSISIPCVAGPYTTINATLRLKKSRIRAKANLTEELVDNFAGIQSIATSAAQNDSGLFELNFRDERYLPFEGTGAVSEWTLEMMEDRNLRQFDYNTIADVIVHMRYTAREGVDKNKVTGALKDKLKAITGETVLSRLFSLRHDFPNEWHAWKKAEAEVFTLKLEKHHFPYFAQLGEISIEEYKVYKKGEYPNTVISSAEKHTIKTALALTGLLHPKPDDNLLDYFLVLNYSVGEPDDHEKSQENPPSTGLRT